MKQSEPTIVTMGPGDEDRILEVCELLVRSFRDLSPTWVPTVEAARAKVVGALEPGMLSRVLLIDGRVLEPVSRMWMLPRIQTSVISTRAQAVFDTVHGEDRPAASRTAQGGR